MTGLVAVALLATPALADDWVATKLRGTVLVLDEGNWQKLGRGDVVSDARVIRTLRGGRVTFQRGAELIDLGGDTQIRIHDKDGRKFTTVMQDFGTVSVEAEVRDVEHFSVKTPHLAAVVKGTRFTVHSGDRDAEVTVERGRVAVEDGDTHQSTVVIAGQSAGTADGAPLTVSGRGDLPAVMDARGRVVVAAEAPRTVVSATDAAAAARSAALASGASPKEADKAAKDAAKEADKSAKEAAKEARSDAREAAKDARDTAKSEGGTSKEADKAEKEAAKEERAEAREAAKETRSEAGNSGNGNGSGSSSTGDTGSSGNSGHGNGGGNSDSSGNSGNGNGGGNSDSSGNGNSGNSGNDNGNSGDGHGHGKKD